MRGGEEGSGKTLTSEFIELHEVWFILAGSSLLPPSFLPLFPPPPSLTLDSSCMLASTSFLLLSFLLVPAAS